MGRQGHQQARSPCLVANQGEDVASGRDRGKRGFPSRSSLPEGDAAGRDQGGRARRQTGGAGQPLA